MCATTESWRKSSSPLAEHAHAVKVTIQCASETEDVKVRERRTLGVLEFAPKTDGRNSTLVLPDTPLAVDANHSLVLHSAYSPGNRGLSVMVGYQSPEGEMHVFTGMAVWEGAPYFAFRLPSGDFIELHFERERDVVMLGSRDAT